MPRGLPFVLWATLLVSLAVAAAPSPTPSPADAARAQGAQLLAKGEFEAAAESLEQALELAPDDAEAHHLLGAAYGIQAANGGAFTGMRLVGRVKEHFERAVALVPDSIDYRRSLLQFYAAVPAIGGGGMAKARLQAAEIAKRDAVEGELAYAIIAAADDDPEEAHRRLSLAYAQRPDDQRIGVQLGLVLQQQERYDEAFVHFQAMTARDAGAMSAWYQLGRTSVLAKQRLVEGEAAFKRYLAHQPKDSEPPLAAAHWRLGMLYELMKDLGQARTQYQAALALDPEHDEAKAALKKL